MFGHQPDPVPQNSSNDNHPVTVSDNHDASSFNPALPPDNMSFAPSPQASVPMQAPVNDTPAQFTPVTDPNNLLEQQADDGYTSTPPAQDTPTYDAPAAETPAYDSPVTDQTVTQTVGVSGPLGDLKQQALQQLTPLVGHLEQTPEEKFRTTMMMIQASDNKDLLQTAYDAANQISDEKARAQALLDVINEINYFAQQG
jgi:hypothetical protein